MITKATIVTGKLGLEDSWYGDKVDDVIVDRDNLSAMLRDLNGQKVKVTIEVVGE